MKKWIAMLLCCLLLTGCAAAGTGTAPIETDATTAPTQQTTITEAADAEPTDDGSVETDTTESTVVKFNIYTPNENLDGFYATEIVVDALTAENVVSELVKENVLTGDITVNLAEIVDGQLNLDFNGAFADLINSQGTTGESMIMGSLVNTFLSAYGPSGAETVYITVDGQILESGHVVYDFPMEFHE